MGDRIIFHVDVNSAYLSWEAAYRLQLGEIIDLRKIPAAIGGDIEKRQGVILAKSIPCKKYKINTGESIYLAKQKCPELIIVPPNHDLYTKCSNTLIEILQEYTPKIEKFSIDECFLDFTDMNNLYKDYIELAYEMKNRIKKQLGFTVNIGISSNKLLAKMASEFEKPDRVHTLFPNEIADKMWPLPVSELFMVGKATLPKLNLLNIFTIGDLAKYDLNTLKSKFKSFGVILQNYANGIDCSQVENHALKKMKSIGNSTTLSYDVDNREEAHAIILSICENVSMRLREYENCCNLVSIIIKDNCFFSYSHERKLHLATDCTNVIASAAYKLFDEVWKNEPVRQLGVSVSGLCGNDFHQLSFLEEKLLEKNRHLDKTIDHLRLKYGSSSLVRGVFIKPKKTQL